jgi:hypothetical protein
MRKLTISIAVALGIVACQKQHPIRVDIDPAMQKGTIGKIAVFPFVSAINEAEDPDHIAPMTMDKYFKPELNERRDYNFIASNTLTYAIEREGLGESYRTFLQDYPQTEKADPAFLGRLADILKCDAFLIPIVDTWQKDEVDVLENATPATYVGATLVVLGKNGEKVLFRATDEDYMEGARSETADRQIQTGASGAIRADFGAKLYRAPPYDEVAVKVIQALVGSLPVR